MATTVPEALAEVQAARIELYEASAERRRLSLAPMRKPELIDAANARIAAAREALAETRAAAQLLMFGS